MEDDFYERLAFLHTEKDKDLFRDCRILQGIAEQWTNVSNIIAINCKTNNYSEIEPFCIQSAEEFPEKIIGNEAWEKLKKRTILSGTTSEYFGAIAMIIVDMYCQKNNIPIPNSNII